jgi:hypothetical protein
VDEHSQAADRRIRKSADAVRSGIFAENGYRLSEASTAASSLSGGVGTHVSRNPSEDKSETWKRELA